jgi:hypothetical protein
MWLISTSCDRQIRQVEATLRGGTDTHHRYDLVIHWITPDRMHQNGRQVRVGNVILRLLKHQVVGLRDTAIAGRHYLTLYVNGLSTAQRDRLDVKPDQPTAVNGACPGNGLT